MHKQTNKITGILLAGGLSKRMGVEKGTLRIGSLQLYQYALKVLEELCDEILISTCKEASFQERHRMVCDEIQGIGPMGGIYTCLKQSANDLNIVLSYDMPLVSSALIDHLLGERQSWDIVLPALVEERPEPLCGIYMKHTIPTFEKLISQRRYAVHHALTEVNSKIVLIDKWMSFWNPDIFLNVNKEEDLRKLPPGLKLLPNES